MRLWTLHPRYLDRSGLTGGWREALLAQAVLAGRTRGYRSHPQLIRFHRHADTPAALGAYLAALADEAERRGYRFDRSRIDRPPVTTAQTTAATAATAGTSDGADAADGTDSADRVQSADSADRVQSADSADRVQAADRADGADGANGAEWAHGTDGTRSTGRLTPIPVTEGQVAYEWQHLLAKLAERSPERHAELRDVVVPEVHPLFEVIPGPIEDWERP